MASKLYEAIRDCSNDLEGLITSESLAYENEGQTAMSLACWMGATEPVAQMIAYGADVNGKRKADGFTPLHIACDEGHLALVQILLSSLANVELSAPKVGTPLHLAASKGRAEICQVLIDSAKAAFPTDAFLRFLNAPNPDQEGASPLVAAMIGGTGNDAVSLILTNFGARVPRKWISRVREARGGELPEAFVETVKPIDFLELQYNDQVHKITLIGTTPSSFKIKSVAQLKALVLSEIGPLKEGDSESNLELYWSDPVLTGGEWPYLSSFEDLELSILRPPRLKLRRRILLTELEDYAILQILGFLSEPIEVCRVGACCRILHRITNDASVWAKFAKEEQVGPFAPETEKEAKEGDPEAAASEEPPSPTMLDPVVSNALAGLVGDARICKQAVVECYYGNLPQEYDQGANPNYGNVRVGSLVKLGKHREIRGNVNWHSDMDKFVGRIATVNKLSGTDSTGSPGLRVTVDGKDTTFFWRIRDCKLIKR